MFEYRENARQLVNITAIESNDNDEKVSPKLKVQIEYSMND